MTRPQTPAEHHALAVSLANDAADLPPHSASALVLATLAAAHASLALYSPRVIVVPADLDLEALDHDELERAINALHVVPDAPAPTAKKTTSRPRKAAAPKETTS